MNKTESLQLLQDLAEKKQQILTEIHKVIIGQDKVVNELLIALFSGGHCLIEGVPGLAKTLMVSTLSQILNLSFNRIQFTPDLMPSDITGTDILAENKADGKRYFEYIKGPIFANIILADEINRTPPKTQSALLQAMQEYQITAGNETFALEKPFLVLATQNPIEQEGTYPLPEAQLDRFMFNINIDYPNIEEEKEIVKSTTMGEPEVVIPVLDGAGILAMQNAIREIPVSDHVLNYAVNLVRMTRPGTDEAPEFLKQLVTWGAGPRASQYLVIAAKTRAALENRLAPAVEDIDAMADIILQHRIIVSFTAEAEGLSSRDVILRLKEYLKAQN
ncbi:MAG: MoxR family ATPase [Candidatus Cloacimonetes bacterium]|nr:MoxR family ATPase [Candidatus Cloacimonadota bacterium]